MKTETALNLFEALAAFAMAYAVGLLPVMFLSMILGTVSTL